MIFKVIICVIYISWILYWYYIFKKEEFIGYLNWLGRIFFPIVIALTCVISVYFLIYIYYTINGDHFTKADIISICENCISFIGTFGLGYFIYRKGEDNRIIGYALECEKLICTVKATQDITYRIVNWGYKTKKIEYDSNWLNYYLKFELIEGTDNTELCDTIKRYFSFLDEMNVYIVKEEYDKALERYHKEKKREKYSISKYNIDEAMRHIEYACMEKRDGISLNYKALLEKKEVLTLIHKCADKYYSIIENKVYNYLIQNSIAYIDNYEMVEKLVDWLLKDSKLSEDIISYHDERVLVKMLLECFDMIGKNSSRVRYSRGELALR